VGLSMRLTVFSCSAYFGATSIIALAARRTQP
jgi:hypothetical protein